jgi:two-component system, OmpR family, osmolarity sensor histidine kinase EnvZ
MARAPSPTDSVLQGTADEDGAGRVGRETRAPELAARSTLSTPLHIWPRSLLWRTFLLLALLAVATTAAWYLIFRTYERLPRAREIAQNMVSVVNLTRAALISAQPDRRRELLEDLAEREGIQVYPATPDERIIPPPDTPLIRLVNAEVRAQLGNDTRFAFLRNDLPGFWVSFRIAEDEYWVRVPRERLERRVALQWVGWGILALALSLLAAYFIVSVVSRPLKALAKAAAEIGRGRSPAPVPESGPVEMQMLSRAFNQMSRDLARLDEDRTLILAGVSHDLRTPLARLRLGIEISGGDESLKEGMSADIDEMDRIIGQFLDFARAEGENSVGEPRESIELESLAAEIIDYYGKLGHAIDAEFAHGLVVRIRPKAIRRALGNLVDNALRYGGPKVALRGFAEGRNAVIEVLDRGPGIPAREVERMKLPFTRLDPARGGKGGSGLGLAIVERVAQSHGGKLELLAREGGGLTARLTLPDAALASV